MSVSYHILYVKLQQLLLHFPRLFFLHVVYYNSDINMDRQKKVELKQLIISEVFTTKQEQRIVSSQGNESGWVFDFRSILMRADVLALLSDIFWEKYKTTYPFQLGCLETAGIPLVTGIACALHNKEKKVNAFFIRKSRKKHGLLNMVEGILSDDRVILVDDIINSGNSFIRQVEVLEALGKKVEVVFSILQFRDDSFYEYFHKKNIRVESLFMLNDFNDSLGLTNLVPRKQKSVPMPFTVSWYFKSEQPNYFYVVPKSAPVIDTHNLYYGSDSGIFWALNQVDGSVVWKFKVGFHAKGKYIFSSPAVYKDMVYFGAYDGNVYALDVKTGKSRWIFMEADWVGSSPIVSEKLNLLFIGLEFGLFKKRGGVVALDAVSGEKVWQFNTVDYVHASPAYSQKNNLVVCGSNNNSVYGLNAKTGHLRWEYKTEGEVKAAAAFDEKRGWTCFGSHDSYFYIVSSKDGTLIKKIKTGFGIYSTPLVFEDKVYVSSLDKKLYCVDLKSLEIRWEFETSGRIFASPTIINGHIYIGSNDGRLYELDPETGQLTAQYQAVERITNKIISNKEGTCLFLPTFANEMICLKRDASI